MLDTHHTFWNRWAADYQGFSETIEPYRAAQRALAEAVVIALGEAARSLKIGGFTCSVLRTIWLSLVARLCWQTTATVSKASPVHLRPKLRPKSRAQDGI